MYEYSTVNADVNNPEIVVSNTLNLSLNEIIQFTIVGITGNIAVNSNVK